MVSFISRSEAQEYHEKGWRGADLHVHSARSHDVPFSSYVEPEAILERARALGLAYRTITDHDTLTPHNDISGVELTVDDPRIGHSVHVNIYDLNEQQFRELETRRFDIDSVLRYCRNAELPALYNHPYWFKPQDARRLESDDGSVRRAMQSIEEIAQHVSVIEFNAKRNARSNDRAIDLAQRHGKGLLGTTDTHTGDVGTVYTLAPGETFRDWWMNVEKRNARIVDTNPGAHFGIEAGHYVALAARLPRPDSRVTGLIGHLISNIVTRRQNSFSQRLDSVI